MLRVNKLLTEWGGLQRTIRGRVQLLPAACAHHSSRALPSEARQGIAKSEDSAKNYRSSYFALNNKQKQNIFPLGV